MFEAESMRSGMKGRKYNPGQTKLILLFVDGYAKKLENVAFYQITAYF